LHQGSFPCGDTSLIKFKTMEIAAIMISFFLFLAYVGTLAHKERMKEIESGKQEDKDLD
jgi:hypothetical protein